MGRFGLTHQKCAVIEPHFPKRGCGPARGCGQNHTEQLLLPRGRPA